MNALAQVLTDLHHGEDELARYLLEVGQRHHAEPEVHHLTRILAGWSAEHVTRLAATGHRYGLRLDDTAGEEADEPGRWFQLRERAAELLGRRESTGLLLLDDLGTLHLMAAGNSLHWELAAQAAQASRDGELLDLVSDCHPQTLRQLRWTNSMLKILSPQILTST